MDDERLAQIEAERQQMQSKNDSMYNDLLQDNENLYNQQKEYANTWEQTTNNNLDKQLEFNTNLINQQKDKATGAYETETKKAKNDFTAYTNPYGLQAEQFASQGLLKSGVAETAKLGGYNSYQNRLAAANKTWQDAITQYDNDINQARLTNDVQKAENAVKKLEMNLQYTNSYFNNKSSLKQNQFSNSLSIGGDYFNRYNTVYNNIQAEKERQEAIRQYQEQFEYKKQQDALAQRNWEKEYALSRSRYGGDGGYIPITEDKDAQKEEVYSYNDVSDYEPSNNIFTKVALNAINAASNSASSKSNGTMNYNDAIKKLGSRFPKPA